MQSEQPKYQIGMTVSACLWFGLFPLLQGGTYAHITYDKWIIMLILTGVTVLCFSADLIRMYIAQRKGPGSPLTGFLSPLADFRSSLPFILAFALLLWTILSCRMSDYGWNFWFLGETSRYEALASQLCYFALFTFFFFSRVNMKPVLLSAAAALAVYFVIVLLQRGGGNPLGLYPSGRSYARNREFQGTIGNIDMGTGYLLLLAGLFLSSLLDLVTKNRKIGPQTESSAQPSSDPGQTVKKAEPEKHHLRPLLLGIVYGTAFSVAVFLILSMDVQFGFISLFVLFVYTLLRYMILLRFVLKKWRLPILVFLIILVFIVVWFWPGTSGGIWELHEILHGRPRLSFGSNRVAAWLFSLYLARENLLFGGGSGTFNWRFNLYLSDHYLAIPKEQDGKALPDYFDNPHNEYVGQLTDHGIPGLLLFVSLLLLALFHRRDGWFPLFTPCATAVLCYMVQAFFSFSVCIVAPMFWVLVGQSFRENS